MKPEKLAELDWGSASKIIDDLNDMQSSCMHSLLEKYVGHLRSFSPDDKQQLKEELQSAVTPILQGYSDKLRTELLEEIGAKDAS